MNKVTYKTSNLFTLKHYEDSNLNCQSYNYPTLYGIRCAILGSIITIDGVEKARELFHKVKNAIIKVQYPEEFQMNVVKLKRYANAYYKVKDIKTKTEAETLTTMGLRQYYYLPQIVFYIDDSIPELETYLKNIDWLGTAETLVYLDSIEKVSNMDNVLCQWNEVDDKELFEQNDWDIKTEFDTVYMFSDKYRHIHKSFMCDIRSIEV